MSKQSEEKGFLRLARLFSDHAVLQRETPVPVWGWTVPGLRVRVALGAVTAETRADGKGKFLIRLPPMPAGGPYELSVITPDPDASQKIKDVMVGEVWLCSGQSNMEMSVAEVALSLHDTEAADTHVRSFTVPQAAVLGRQSDVDATWQVASPSTTGAFSAVAFFFGRRLAQDLGITVGVINTSWGGTRIETWISREELVRHPWTRHEVARYEASTAAPAYWNRFDPFEPDDPNAIANSVTPLDVPFGPSNPQSPYMLNDSMIQPLIPYAIRGATWYQGESNAEIAREYGWMLRAMIRDWRRAWGQGDFPFLTVQLANYSQPMDYQPASTWAVVREGQLQSLQEANTGLAVAIDIGDAVDIHPRNKHDVGDRLAQWALVRTYGKQGSASGPLYRDCVIEDNQIRIRFDYVGSGLTTKNGELKTFMIASVDKRFVPAIARIEGDTVVVEAKAVPQPIAVRYGWADNPDGCNLTNHEGMPASPFRTDAW